MSDRPAAFGRVTTIWLLNGAGIMAGWTFLPLYARAQGIGDESIGSAVTLYGIALLVSSYLFGRASDIRGRSRYILLGLGLTTLITICHVFIFDSASLWILRALGGFAIGIYPAAFVDYVARGRGKIGRFSAWGSLGWGIGALSGGILAYMSGLLFLPFLLAGAFFAASFFIARHLPAVPEVHQSVPLFPIALIRRNLSVYIPMLIRHSGASGIWAFWPLFLAELGADPLWIGINQLINPLTQFVIMYTITDTMRSRTLFPVGLILSALAIFSFTLARNNYELLPTQVLLGISWSCCYVGALRLVIETSEEKATASGLLNSVTSLSQIIGPAIATALIGVTHSYLSIMYLGAAMSAASFLLYYPLERYTKEKVL